MTSQTKLKTPITYYGGKQNMLKHILPLIPEHDLYTEAFCGGCALFFAKEPVMCEIINDLDSELINFFAITQRNFPLLKEEITASLHSRELHIQATHIRCNPYFFSPVQRAWATWVLSKMSYASKLDGTFGFDRQGTTALTVSNARCGFVEELSDRLKKATIEHDDALKVIKRYDREGAFHFVDPPYIGSNCGHYAGSFNEQNLNELLQLLSEIKAKFMLTMFPNETIQEYADRFGWTIHKIERTISASKTSRRKQEEWIICNY